MYHTGTETRLWVRLFYKADGQCVGVLNTSITSATIVTDVILLLHRCYE